MLQTTPHIIKELSLGIVLLPLLGAIIAGFFGKVLGKTWTHRLTILLVGASLVLSAYVCKLLVFDGVSSFNGTIYVWAISGGFQFNVGFLIDNLTALMMVTVTFVSFLVHVYSIGYMQDDKGYQRFFCYISLFTFMMLMLVTANNFLQLFFGWEGVGLVSYLLIGFWFHRESANFGSLKAFIVNRVGDMGFILGIAAVMTYFGTIDYATAFKVAPQLTHTTITILPGVHWSILSVTCILLFIGAMGKSAQMPLHVWLPESMEGPTPISALIHAATMVTAGVFMVARMSPLFELSQAALSMIIVIGGVSALFMGLLGLVQNDIKRVIAYSTLSQLGYMMVAMGASAFSAGIFHLITHASFKALLFLAAGSVIIGMHHDQDMRNMGNLKKYMPITYIAFLIGALSLSAIPPFAGFYSKDAIVEAVHLSTIPGAHLAYYSVLLGAFVTALYSFRAFFMTFHTNEKMTEYTRKSLKESPWVVWVPLAVLAIPAVILGCIMAGPILYSQIGLLGSSVYVAPQYNVLHTMAADWHGAFFMFTHSIFSGVFWLGAAGVITAWVCYILKPQLPEFFKTKFSWVYTVLTRKYGFDDFNQLVFAKGSVGLGRWLFYTADARFIDDFFVNGSGRSAGWLSKLLGRSQSGYLYHYAFVMILGLLGFLIWLLFLA